MKGKQGTYYYYKNSYYEYIFEYKGEDEEGPYIAFNEEELDFTDGDFTDELKESRKGKNCREATPEEIQWFKLCVEAGEAVPRPKETFQDNYLIF